MFFFIYYIDLRKKWCKIYKDGSLCDFVFFKIELGKVG